MASRILLLGLMAHSWTETLQLPLIDGSVFVKKIERLVEDGLALKKIQSMLDGEKFQTQEIDGQSIIDSLTKQLGDSFKSAFEAVRRIKNASEQGYIDKLYSQRAIISRCCQVNESRLETMQQYKRKVDINKLCYRVSPMSPDHPTIPASDAILKTMKKNAEHDRWLKWQYLGTEEGIFTTFPARRDPGCLRFPTRFRPWYVETATPTPRDIVLVMDTSESMRIHRLMNTTKEAALTVMDSLNPNDRVGFVSFSDKVFTPTGSTATSLCYADSLAFATPDNKAYLKSYIRGLTADGGSQFADSLKTAFQHMRKVLVDDTRERMRVILFLTDGHPSDSKEKIENVIRQNNAALNNTVTILTYGIGTEISQSAENLLRRIAHQNFSDPEHGEVTPGVYTKVDDSKHLREKLGTYYDSLGCFLSDKPIVSVPYIDFSGLGIISSVCLPVYIPDTADLKGVACVDISLSELASSVRFFDHGQFSYAFLVDSTGRTTIHPLLPRPEAGNNPVIVNIEELERDDSVVPILDAIRKGGSGKLTLEKNFQVSRGNASRDGMKKERMKATYYWSRIPDTDFSLCIVIAARDKQVEVSLARSVKNFVYHRLDILANLPEEEDRAQLCSHLGTLGTSGHSVVKFTKSAFENPDIDFLNGSDTYDSITRYKFYMEGRYDDAFRVQLGFKKGVKDMVTVTAGADAIWRQASTFNPYTIYRYLGMNDGFIRLLPGQILTSNYDHVQRLWYKAAMANAGVTVLTTPYKDAFGAGIITTLCGVVKMGRKPHTGNEPIIGVAGMDLKMSYIRKIMVETVHACSNSDYVCFIVDTSGYFIYRDDINYDSENYISNRHITEKEPDISNHLIRERYLTRHTCAALDTKQNIFTWQLILTQSVENMEGVPAYSMQIVPGTNMYIAIKKRTTGAATTCSCPRQFPIYADLPKCESVDVSHCECPCHAKADFDFCTNRYTKPRDGYDPCSPWLEEPIFKPPPLKVTGGMAALPACVNRTCIKKEQVDCKGTVGCSWCITDYKVEERCAELIECIETTTPNIVTGEATKDNNAEGRAIAAAVGSAVGVLFLAIIIAVVVCCCKSRYGERQYDRSGTEYSTSGGSLADTKIGYDNPAQEEEHYDSIEDLTEPTAQIAEPATQRSGRAISLLVPGTPDEGRYAENPGIPDSIIGQPIKQWMNETSSPPNQITDLASKPNIIRYSQSDIEDTYLRTTDKKDNDVYRSSIPQMSPPLPPDRA